MMPLGNNNMVYMMVSNENNVSSSPAVSVVETHTGQFPTYTVVTSPPARVTQMMTNVAKSSLVSDIDDPVKSPVNKTSIISVVKGSYNSNQQISVRKSSSSHEVINESQSQNVPNDVHLIHPRTSVGEASTPHKFRKNNSPQDIITESQNRNIPPEGQTIHHKRVSTGEMFSPSNPMNNLLPPSYHDATRYSLNDAPHAAFQIQSPFEARESIISIHQQGDIKNQQGHESSRTFHQHTDQKGQQQIHDLTRSSPKLGEQKTHHRHESNRTLHHQNEQKVQIIHEPVRPSDQQGEPKNPQIIHESSRPSHQQGDQKNQQIYESSRSLYQMNEQQKNQQKHESMRPLQQQQESARQLQQESARPTQLQEPSRSLQQKESMRPLQQQESIRQSQQESMRQTQQQESIRQSQQQESIRPTQQQESMRQSQQQESMRSLQQQESMRQSQQQESMRPTQQQESMRQSQQQESKRQLQKQESMRPLQQHESMRSSQQESMRLMQQQGDQKNQQIRESSRPLYHIGDQKNQQLHEPSRPLYQFSDQKKQQQMHESARHLHQQGEHKGQQFNVSNRSIYQHNEQKNQQSHESSRHSHQKNQHIHESHQPLHQLTDHKKQQVHEPARSPHQHSDQKGQQIHVHKVHHGNARVKYVEFKPSQEGMKYRQMLHHSQHSYNPNLKQTLYYSNHLANNPSSHHLTVQTPTHSPLSPLHSPPALRPPPPIPSGSPWHSPPSLVPSPEVRPRFDFISSPQPVTTAINSGPVQVANMVQHKIFPGKGGKQVNISGNHNILLPRLPANYQMARQGHPNNSHPIMVPRSKAAFIQAVSPNSPASQSVYDNSPTNFPQSGIPSTSVATTVTVTMTYIPIPTSTKDKFVYVPVNSGQPVVLYQNQQSVGKPVVLPPQLLHGGSNVSNTKDITKDAYSTVRLQGLVNCGFPKSSNFTPVPNSQNNQMKNFKYHLANTSLPQGANHTLKKSPGFIKLDHNSSQFNMDMFNFEQEKYNLTPMSSKDIMIGQEIKYNDQIYSGPNNNAKFENQGEVMTLINNQLRLVPPHVGINNQTPHIGIKRNNSGYPIPISGIPSTTGLVTQSPLTNTLELGNEGTNTTMENITNLEGSAKDDKKKRGRPAQEKVKRVRKDKKGKTKFSGLQGNSLLSIFSSGQAIANQVFVESYKKQQQIQLQKHYLEDPQFRVPELPPTPETWTAEDVHKFLLTTDCACYADAIKAEEIDGKSFLLLTREALMEFLSVKLGPALKIAGHAASLRARQRIYSLSMQEQQNPLPPKEKKSRLPSTKHNTPKQDTSKSDPVIIKDDPIDIPIVSTAENHTDIVIPKTTISTTLTIESESEKVKHESDHVQIEQKQDIIKVPDPPPAIIIDDSNCSTLPEIVIDSNCSNLPEIIETEIIEVKDEEDCNKLPEIMKINGEYPDQLPGEDNSNKLPGDAILSDHSINDMEKILLNVSDVTTTTSDKLDFSQKNSSSPLSILTEMEESGSVIHEIS